MQTKTYDVLAGSYGEVSSVECLVQFVCDRVQGKCVAASKHDADREGTEL